METFHNLQRWYDEVFNNYGRIIIYPAMYAEYYQRMGLLHKKMIENKTLPEIPAMIKKLEALMHHLKRELV